MATITFSHNTTSCPTATDRVRSGASWRQSEKALTVSEGSASAGGADAQELLPGNPLREELADVGRDSDAACWNAKPPLLDDPHAVSSFRENEGDCEASKSCEDNAASEVKSEQMNRRRLDDQRSTRYTVRHIPPPTTRKSTSNRAPPASEAEDMSCSCPATRLGEPRYISKSVSSHLPRGGGCAKQSVTSFVSGNV